MSNNSIPKLYVVREDVHRTFKCFNGTKQGRREAQNWIDFLKTSFPMWMPDLKHLCIETIYPGYEVGVSDVYNLLSKRAESDDDSNVEKDGNDDDDKNADSNTDKDKDSGADNAKDNTKANGNDNSKDNDATTADCNDGTRKCDIKDDKNIHDKTSATVSQYTKALPKNANKRKRTSADKPTDEVESRWTTWVLREFPENISKSPEIYNDKRFTAASKGAVYCHMLANDIGCNGKIALDIAYKAGIISSNQRKSTMDLTEDEAREVWKNYQKRKNSRNTWYQLIIETKPEPATVLQADMFGDIIVQSTEKQSSKRLKRVESPVY